MTDVRLPELGLLVFSAGAGRERFDRASALALRAEQAGFSRIWAAELYDRSATVMLAHLAPVTTRVRIGSSIAYGVGRSPMVWAADARDLDELSGGRLILGLGNGNAKMMEDWLGVSSEAPAVRMEELVPLLRELWRLHEGPVDHEGRFYRVHIRPAPGTRPPLRPAVPIHIAGINPRMVQAAGRVADGLIGHPMFTDKYVDEVVRPALAAGTAKAGRDPRDVEVVRVVMCSIDDDLELARRRLTFAISQYAASRIYDRLFALHGWSARQRSIREAVRARDMRALVAAVPDDAVDAIGIACRPGELAARLAQRRADEPLTLSAPSWGLEPEVLEGLSHRIVDEIDDPQLGARFKTDPEGERDRARARM